MSRVDRPFGIAPARPLAWRVNASKKTATPTAAPPPGPQGESPVLFRARQIIEGLGLEAATPADAREILSLKGGDKVAF